MSTRALLALVSAAGVGAAGHRAELGRYLFYDSRMSGNGTQSCASCHRQELAFTDGRTVAVGSTGEAHTRNAMTLVNVRSAATLTWADPTIRSLEQQALVPMFGEHPVELGVRRAEFERTIVSQRSPYDRYYLDGDRNAISDAAKRGEVVFFTESLGGCFRRHARLDFTDVNNAGRGTDGDKTPTLRNVELTAGLHARRQCRDARGSGRALCARGQGRRGVQAAASDAAERG